MTSDNTLHPALARALARLLRPLVRVLLRHGMPWGAFEAVAKKTFVEVAMADFPLPGRKPSMSRASILTGLTRKDVQRLVAEPAAGEDLSTLQYNRAAKVLTAWSREPAFRGPDDAPRPLAIEGEAGFAALVKGHSGDMPVRAVLDELLRVGAVELLEDGRVALLQRGFVPQQSALQKIGILGTDVAQLVETVAHNIEHGATDPRFQRKVMHRGIPHDVLPAFRELSAREGQALLERLDAWLAVRDLAHRADLQRQPGVRTARVGVGIFHFEQADDTVPQ
jgi:hypothetical protein